MKKKSKILFCLPAFTFGGTVFSTLNMLYFLKKDYDVYVLPMTYQGPVIEEYKKAGIKLLSPSRKLSAMMGRIKKEKGLINKSISVFYKLIRKISKFLEFDYELYLFRKEAARIEKEYEFDFVASCQEGGSTYFVSCFSKSKKIAWFRSEYSVYKNQLTLRDKNKEQKIYSNFDNIVCVSRITRNDFCAYFHNLKGKIFAIHNIQFTDRIVNLSKQNPKEYADDKFIIISVGRFAPQKRFSYIPIIANDLKNKGLFFSWYIIGDGNMGGEYDKTIKEIEYYQVNDRVHCIGSRLNPYPYIKNADILVVPSYYEACPRVVIEAKILHTPVVCANFSSSWEFVNHGVDGYVDELENLSDHIGKMIKDKDAYKAIKKECDQYFIDNNAIYQQLKEVFS